MWVGMDEFLAKHSTVLQVLSVNLDLRVPENHDMVQVNTLIGKAEDSFPRMSRQLGETGGKFERKVKITFR
jgi:hypothetical protein